MGFRKFKADHLFTGRELLPSNAVLITNEAGVVENLIDQKDAGEDIESYVGLLTPGFINTHCHLELSHLKGRITPGLGLVNFLTQVIKERNNASELINEAMAQAENELYENGVMAVADVCNTTDSLNIKINSRICWRNFIEVLGFDEEKAEERLAYSGKILEEFHKGWPIPDKRLSPENRSIVYNQEPSLSCSSLIPHASYSVSPKLFKLINEASAGEIISIHNQETEAENELFLHNQGEILQLYRNLNIDASFLNLAAKQVCRPICHG